MLLPGLLASYRVYDTNGQGAKNMGVALTDEQLYLHHLVVNDQVILTIRETTCIAFVSRREGDGRNNQIILSAITAQALDCNVGDKVALHVFQRRNLKGELLPMKPSHEKLFRRNVTPKGRSRRRLTYGTLRDRV